MLTVATVLALVLAYLALVAAYFALRTLAKLRRSTAVLAKGLGPVPEHESLLEATERHIRIAAGVAAELDALRAELAAIQAATAAAVEAGRVEIAGYLGHASAELASYRAELDSDLAQSIRNVALVRYDAFEDLAGRMSFSMALLDDRGDGVSVTSIAGRSDTRVYAKGIRDGASETDLSPEEHQVVAAALRGRSARAARAAAANRAAGRSGRSGQAGRPGRVGRGGSQRRAS